MNIKEAVEKRIIELCNERNIAINALANISGVSPSTIYSMLNEKSKNPVLCQSKRFATVLKSASDNSSTAICLMIWNKRLNEL